MSHIRVWPPAAVVVDTVEATAAVGVDVAGVTVVVDVDPDVSMRVVEVVEEVELVVEVDVDDVVVDVVEVGASVVVVGGACARAGTMPRSSDAIAMTTVSSIRAFDRRSVDVLRAPGEASSEA